ncbi:hypothetical protein AYJ66_11810 [Dietzia cinnamea]|nr:hypothetical protein AYJ66_11810 [Dietzia cinnamea]
MTLGVDAYLNWAPADMTSGADWLRVKSDLGEEAARGIREGGERGTEGQCGQFITRRREESEEISGRLFQLADMLHGASKVVRAAAAELDVLVAGLRQVEYELLDQGFVRVEGEHVRDTRTTYADATERSDRESEAEGFRERIWELLGAIRETDDRANRELHGIVGREVRDRTAAGNGDPWAVGLSGTAKVSAAAATGASLVEEKWYEAVLDSGRGTVAANALGPVMAGLGFLGGVASRPGDEPLREAIVAEGVGTIAGFAGGPLGIAAGLVVGGPPGGVVGGAAGTLGGGPYLSALASSWVRGAFDRAN